MTIPYQDLPSGNPSYSSNTQSRYHFKEDVDESGREALTKSPRNNDTARDPPEVVFRTAARYSPILWLLLAFSVFIVLICIVPIVMDPNSTADNKRFGVITLLGSVCFMVVVYIAVLPVAFQVRSDRAIGVVTMLCTYHFPGAVRAYPLNGSTSSSSYNTVPLFRPRIKFATDLSSRINIRRTSGMDLLVSPQDENGFIQAVQSVQPQLF